MFAGSKGILLAIPAPHVQSSPARAVATHCRLEARCCGPQDEAWVHHGSGARQSCRTVAPSSAMTTMRAACSPIASSGSWRSPMATSTGACVHAKVIIPELWGLRDSPSATLPGAGNIPLIPIPPAHRPVARGAWCHSSSALRSPAQILSPDPGAVPAAHTACPPPAGAQRPPSAP